MRLVLNVLINEISKALSHFNVHRFHGKLCYDLAAGCSLGEVAYPLNKMLRGIGVDVKTLKSCWLTALSSHVQLADNRTPYISLSDHSLNFLQMMTALRCIFAKLRWATR